MSDAMLASLDSTTLQRLLEHLASMAAAERPGGETPSGTTRETPSGTTVFSSVPRQRHIMHHGPLPANAGPLAANTGLLAANTGLLAANAGSPAANTGLLAANAGPPAANAGLLAANAGPLAANAGPLAANAGPLSSVQPLAEAPRSAMETATFKSSATVPSVTAVTPDQIISDPAGGGGGLRFYYFSFPNGVCGFFQADEPASLGSTHAEGQPKPSTTTICPQPEPRTLVEAQPEPSTSICPNLGSGIVSSCPESHAASADARSSDDGSSWLAARGGLSDSQTAAWVGVGGQGEMRVGNEGGVRIAEGHGGQIQIIGVESSSFNRHCETAAIAMDMAPGGSAGCSDDNVAFEPTSQRLENDGAVNAVVTPMPTHQVPVSSISPTAVDLVDLYLHGASMATDTCPHSSRLNAGEPGEPDREPAGVNGLCHADMAATSVGLQSITSESQNVSEGLLNSWEVQQLLAAAAASAAAAAAAPAGTNEPHHFTTTDSSHSPGSPHAPHRPHYLVHASGFPDIDSPNARGALSAADAAAPSAADAAAGAAADRTTVATECAKAESMFVGGCDDYTSLLLMDPLTLIDSLPYPFTTFEALAPGANMLTGNSPRGNMPTEIFSTAAQAAACIKLASLGGRNGDAEVGGGLPQASQDLMAQEELLQTLLLEEAPETGGNRMLSVTCSAGMPADQPVAPEESKQEKGKQQKKRKKTQKKAEQVSPIEGRQLDAAAVKAAPQAKKARKQNASRGPEFSGQGNSQAEPSSAASAAPEPAPARLDSAGDASAGVNSLSTPPPAHAAANPKGPRPETIKRRAEEISREEMRYIGVRKRGLGNRWVVERKDNIHGVRRWLGTFATPEEAAREYDKAAREIRGETTRRTNFPFHK
ncbi:unnamed protein product [Closterium sp. NIES-65]|nr:unnamed protein product [Closterium sp. NIES-65]